MLCSLIWKHIDLSCFRNESTLSTSIVKIKTKRTKINSLTEFEYRSSLLLQMISNLVCPPPPFFLLHDQAHLKSSLTFVIMTSKWIPGRGYLLFSMGYLCPFSTHTHVYDGTVSTSLSTGIPSMNCTMSRIIVIMELN